MKNSTIIDYKILEDAGITPLEFLYLVALFNGEVKSPSIKHHGEIDLKSLEDRLYVSVLSCLILYDLLVLTIYFI